MLALRTLHRRTALACCDPPAAVAEDPDTRSLHAHYIRRVLERRAAAGDPGFHELAVPPVHYPPQPAGPGWLRRAGEAGDDALDQYAADGDDGRNGAGGDTPRIPFGQPAGQLRPATARAGGATRYPVFRADGRAFYRLAYSAPPRGSKSQQTRSPTASP